ncbi:MAG: hypothetical protein A2Y61_06795 [Chloroflexi bacterium RBG_13_60_13]|nr:MAG: hypothetical protein A2Y61_06795 [Chloroflexi bacterium RBG_13_60_13]
MAGQKLIRITIVDDSRGEKCEGRCGLDLSSPEERQDMAELLRKIYGDRVQLDYHDLGDPFPGGVEGLHLPALEEAGSDTWQFPLLLVNGRPRISGYFDLRLMQNVIQAEIEMTE